MQKTILKQLFLILVQIKYAPHILNKIKFAIFFRNQLTHTNHKSYILFHFPYLPRLHAKSFLLEKRFTIKYLSIFHAANIQLKSLSR